MFKILWKYPSGQRREIQTGLALTLDERHEPPPLPPHRPERTASSSTYAERVAPQMLLAGEPLAAGLTGVGPLPCV